ncbi:CocE/NonD family hydrolase C-terminal non-catalytic domain-containing protein, partial [Acinetobacter baumannii]
TAPMTADFYFNGPLEADIWMSSTSTAAELSVRLDDVGPDGTVSPITNGLMSAAFRAVDETRSRYLKGERIQPWHPFTVNSMLPVTPGEPM